MNVYLLIKKEMYATCIRSFGLRLELTDESDRTTVLSGPVVDQAVLHGLLRKERDHGLPLVSVNQVHPKQARGLDFNTDTNHNRSKKERNT
jgi:hypothetical protein